jgi:rhodanese-related sulfurtransferase
MKKIFKEILIIFIVSAIIGLIVNAVNPKGIPLVMDMTRYSTEKSDKLMNDFVNNPTDTSSHKEKPMMKSPHWNEDGQFYEPQNIKLNFAKLLYDKNALYIDGREEVEYKAGHIKNAINIPFEGFNKKTKEEKLEILKNYNKDGIIVCYCKGGDCEVSIDLAYDIAKLGFNSLNIYLGGYKEWEEAGYPVDK